MKTLNGMFAGILVVAAGCGQPGAEEKGDSVTSSPVESAASSFVADTEPSDAVPVGEARASVTDAQAVTLVGIIGGSAEPFVKGLAAFTIVDPQVPYCAPEEGCPTPWDYCCTQDQVRENIATVKVVDDSGNPVADDARTLLGVKELSTVVVRGTAQRDEKGNLTVAATRVFVRPGK